MVSEEYIKAEYPLHLCVWKNDYKNLETVLAKKEVSYCALIKLFPLLIYGY